MKKTIPIMVISAFVLIFLFLTGSVMADEASILAEQYLKKAPVDTIDPGMTLEKAMKIQEQFLEKIGAAYGEVVGYKAGLTNPAVQKSFGVSHPLRGTLLKKMLLKNGSELPADFGARPLYEGDLILRVSNEAINGAKTFEEALSCIDAAVPFIELPDLVYAKNVKINGPALAAINVAARYGIVGDPIPIKASPEWIERLKTFKLQILDEKGALLIEGAGSSLLEHPLNVVLWIRDSLKAEGKKLKKGDLLSLGTITKLTPTTPNTKITARYLGLDPRGPVDIWVRFK